MTPHTLATLYLVLVVALAFVAALLTLASAVDLTIDYWRNRRAQ